MQLVTLGKTGIVVNKNGFGALPIQRISKDDAAYLLRKAYDNGITYFDTARFYTDSEEKMGYALSDIRDKIYIATKTAATNVTDFYKDLETSLRLLKTDYIDVYQFHNPSFCPKPDDGTGVYEAMLDLKEKGIIRHIGLTNHRFHVAKEAIESGLYETIQFPFSYISSEKELELVQMAEERQMGFVCMKALSGGLINDSACAYAYLNQFNVLPIWGIQRESELDEFISYQENPPLMTDERREKIRKDKEELAGDFCRGCGYCMPCPVGIQINDCARMSLFLRRAPHSVYLTEEWAEKMKKIDDCLHCNQCKNKCPYGLDTPNLLKRNYEDFKTFI